jgi:hypothetical protein
VEGGRPGIWSGFKAALAREAAVFRDAECDWGSTAAQLIGRHSMQALLEARGASREVIASAQALRGFFLADADQLSALVAVELSMLPGIRVTSTSRGSRAATIAWCRRWRSRRA